MIYHIAPYADNAGDIVIVDACQKLFRQIDPDIMEIEDWREDKRKYNHAKAVFVGGGGMFIPDTKRNNNSGWSWNITPAQMRTIKVPIIVYSVGYNRFRGQEDFIPRFKESLDQIIPQAKFFSVRERSSIGRLEPYTVHTGLVQWQPCPAQFGGILYREIIKKPLSPYMIFAPAMDRQHLRGDIRWLIPALRYATVCGWKLVVAGHIACDKEITSLLDGVDYEFVDLHGKPVNEILQFYANADLVIGMRLHSLLIPFGFGVPIIPIVSHDKIEDWLLDIYHPEWGVDLRHYKINEKLMFRIDNYNHMTDLEMRNRLWKLTQDNLKTIEGIVIN